MSIKNINWSSISGFNKDDTSYPCSSRGYKAVECQGWRFQKMWAGYSCTSFTYKLKRIGVNANIFWGSPTLTSHSCADP